MSICLFVFLLLQLEGLSHSFQQSQSILYDFEDHSAPGEDPNSIQNTLNIRFAQQRAFQNEYADFTTRKSVKVLNHSVVEDLLAYSGNFRRLNFNLEEQELRRLAYEVRSLYAQDKMALFFISAYFLRACEILEEKKTPTPEIAKLIKKKIKLMMNITSIETYRRQKYGLQAPILDLVEWQELEKEIVPMTPKKFKLLPNHKDEQIESIIMKMVSSAEKRFHLFNLLTQTICKSSNSLSHHINLKIHAKHQRAQMKRVKEKLLRDHFKNHGDRCLNTFLNIAWKRKIEEMGFENLLNKVYEDLNEVDFVVKDLLRAKCMFSHVREVYTAAFSLVKKVRALGQSGHAIKIVEFQNRLGKITCDVMLIVQIDELPCQIQLSLEYDENLFEISHKMYQISRSKVFSPIVLLFDWFQNIGPEFLSKIGEFLVYRDSNVVPERTKQPESLMKQYKLLNQFFHLTSYNDLGHISKQEFQKQMSKQIESLADEIVRPFVKMEAEL